MPSVVSGPTTREVIDFVRQSVRRLDYSSSRCVDGRTQPADRLGLALPGAAVELAVVLMAADRKRFGPDSAMMMVEDFLRSRGTELSWHTDDHEHGSGKLGCGHLFSASSPDLAPHYGVEPKAMQVLIDKVRTKYSHSKTVLVGDHMEQGVLISDNLEWTVAQCGDRSQFFVYDRAASEKLVTELAEYSGMNAELLRQVLSAHTMITLGVLGSSRGKPLFLVNGLGTEALTAEHIGQAPASVEEALGVIRANYPEAAAKLWA